MKKLMIAAALLFGLGVFSQTLYAKCPGGCCWNGGNCYGAYRQTFEAKLEVKVKLFHPFTGFTQPWQFGLPSGTVLLSVTDCSTGETRILSEDTNGEQNQNPTSVFKPAPTFTDAPHLDALFMSGAVVPADTMPELLPPSPRKGADE